VYTLLLILSRLSQWLFLQERGNVMDETARTHLRVCTFKGLQNLALYVGIKQGFFALHGLYVEIVYTTGSVAQISGLTRGEYDLIQTNPDNVVNVDSNPATFGLDPANAAHVEILFGGSSGPLSLYAQPGITTFEDLRGTAPGVDNASSGLALVLRDMLMRNSMVLNRDYTFVVAGGTSARLDALLSEAIPATILYSPYDRIAAERGFNRLAISTDYYAAYASICTAALQPWIETHPDQVTDYIAAYLQALRWIFEPGNALLVQGILESEPALGLDATLARYAYEAFTDPVTGFHVEGEMDDRGLQQVIDLRATYTSPLTPPGVPGDYQDLRWYQQVEEMLNRS
jgi:ABC-type nitrate/sulfonate/bicarbonate transport system substrate-binding protein